jgi:hypothetical protein
MVVGLYHVNLHGKERALILLASNRVLALEGNEGTVYDKMTTGKRVIKLQYNVKP